MRHPLYSTWKGMRQRCNDPNSSHYKYYGGRGIRVCERWDSFELFASDMGDRPEGCTLDRINNDGNYEPTNCKWSTLKQQANNRPRPNLKRSRHPRTKFTEDDVKAIRERIASGESQKNIASSLAVSPSTINAIHKRRNWS